MRECAFCDHTAKLSKEHITSEWMGELFPNEKEFRSTNRHGKVKEWAEPGLDISVRTVCEPCNNTWMSDIESDHAKSVMTPLMTGQLDVEFGPQQAHSLAIFAYKSAIIVDYAQRHREPFFSRRLRHAFKSDLFIPQNINMFLAPYVPENRRRRFDYRVSLAGGELGVGTGYKVELGVFTFGFATLASK